MQLDKLFSTARTIFPLSTIGILLDDTSPTTLAGRLNYYVQQGRLCNPRKGIYAKLQYNPLELANALYTPSYVSLEYVLQRAGVIFQYDVFLQSASLFGGFGFQLIAARIESIQGVPNTALLNGLGELMDSKLKSFVKNKMKTELVSMLQILQYLG